LAIYNDKPWRKHSFYRALRTFWKWVSITYEMRNPFIDRFGNLVITAPKTPNKVLYTITPNVVGMLIEAASCARDKAMISLLADSGVRRGEIASIEVSDLDLERRRIKVLGKGGKEGYLVFGATTAMLLTLHLQQDRPDASLFGLASAGVKKMLQRLESKTGIKCNAHSFRRGFATELRRKGLSELDIAELGRWSSVVMVKRYSKAYTFDDAAERYRPIVE
jgi:integrase